MLGLVGPYLMGVAIDRFISAKQAAGLGTIALWMLGAYVFNLSLIHISEPTRPY